MDVIKIFEQFVELMAVRKNIEFSTHFTTTSNAGMHRTWPWGTHPKVQLQTPHAAKEVKGLTFQFFYTVPRQVVTHVSLRWMNQQM